MLATYPQWRTADCVCDGGPGIGKTALVDAFLRGVKNEELGSRFLSSLYPKSQFLDLVPWIGRGQCIEHYGAGEAYLPVLEAFEQSARTPVRKQIVALFNQYVPLWFAQMPALLTVNDRERLQ